MSSRKMTMVEALRDAMRLAMRSDSSVFILGEDVGVSGGFGGGFTVTLGLSDEFGHERVMDMPISETAIIGAAVGAAMTGMRPIAEMQYGDFCVLWNGSGRESSCEDALHEQWSSEGSDGSPSTGRSHHTRSPAWAIYGSLVYAHAGT